MYKPKIFHHLEELAKFIPIPVSWVDINGGLLGGNDLAFKIMGNDKYKYHIANKKIHECGFHSQDNSSIFLKEIKKIVQEKITITHEESIIDLETKKIRWFLITKSPLFDDNGAKVIGIINVFTETTDRKHLENLQFETLAQKTKTENAISQATHDIRLPVSSLISTIEEYKKEMPQDLARILISTAKSINNIANNLLINYCAHEEGIIDTPLKPIPITFILEDIIDKKIYQHKNLPITLKLTASPSEYYTYIFGDELSFIQMISNLINNLIDVFQNNSGIFKIGISSIKDEVHISIEDNNKIIFQEIKDSCEIGFEKINDIIKAFNGKIHMGPELGKESKITLAFNKIDTPSWLVNEINLNQDDTIVIITEEYAQKWQERLKNYNVNLKIFTYSKEAIEFINNFSTKEKLLLIVDFRIPKNYPNDPDGLDIIDKKYTKRCILETNRHETAITLRLTVDKKIKILPACFIPHVAIKMKNQQ